MAGVVVIGAGPGIGQSVAARFAQEGMPVTVIARSSETLALAREALRRWKVRQLAVRADSTIESQLRAALDWSVRQHGVPDAVVYNAAWIRRDRPGELSSEAHLAAWSVNVLGAMTAAAHIAPAMVTEGGGSFIVTGGMPQPDPDFTSLSLGKAGVRALVAMLAAEYGPAGIHVATVTVGGPVVRGGAFDPDDIAEHYWRLHREQPDEWTTEVLHDGRSVSGRDLGDSARGERMPAQLRKPA